jgi:hypothetical protein
MKPLYKLQVFAGKATVPAYANVYEYRYEALDKGERLVSDLNRQQRESNAPEIFWMDITETTI